ncbi:hypothetical protein PP740_gp008 [Stenotrophomonas phage Philippe]|uniref:Uncharacterized protein n=1 Tax=Stenotrophomonas phage Philippe TaxID=2859655 RepID=A0AAE7WMS6_9CAUD|nr:hypothetical protein PP740_gp008 [Stenotrophomonas phage Philippe]QYW02207.1 hypothetical protein CPT_Philippe_008 [Stenotrophomonas phage Philippe]
MPRLNQHEIDDALSQDHICPGCDLDTQDCICTRDYHPGDYYMEEFDDPDFDMGDHDNFDDDHAAYNQAQWEYEMDRMPLIDPEYWG